MGLSRMRIKSWPLKCVYEHGIVMRKRDSFQLFTVDPLMGRSGVMIQWGHNFCVKVVQGQLSQEILSIVVYLFLFIFICRYA